MQKIRSLILFLFISATIYAQNATLHVALANQTVQSCHLWIPARSFFNNSNGSLEIPLQNGKGNITIPTKKPFFAKLIYHYDQNGVNKTEIYHLYLSPEDDLSFSADADSKITVTGKGSINNQPLLSGLQEPEVQPFYGDTLPNRIIAALNKFHGELKSTFEVYVKQYRPTPDFVRNEAINISYYTPNTYYDFKGNNQYQHFDAYKRNLPQWRAIEDSLFNDAKLNNSNAVISSNYDQLVTYFLMREKERLWFESTDHPVAFYHEWYNTDTATGKKLFAADNQNILREKIINHYFTGQAEEYAYAGFFDNVLYEHNPNNVVPIFDRFKAKFPQSEYVQQYGPAIDTIRKQLQKQPTGEMVILPGNGAGLKSFDEILSMVKGKTVLIDMWGTWCAPCREEIVRHSAALHEYFKNKGLSFYYIANNDTRNVDTWKMLIPYFDLKGTHILASDQLTKDIVQKVKLTGFPTYIIIKKDGTWELSKAGYPMNRDVLIDQLNAALAQ